MTQTAPDYSEASSLSPEINFDTDRLMTDDAGDYHDSQLDFIYAVKNICEDAAFRIHAACQVLLPSMQIFHPIKAAQLSSFDAQAQTRLGIIMDAVEAWRTTQDWTQNKELSVLLHDQQEDYQQFRSLMTSLENIEPEDSYQEE